MMNPLGIGRPANKRGSPPVSRAVLKVISRSEAMPKDPIPQGYIVLRHAFEAMCAAFDQHPESLSESLRQTDHRLAFFRRVFERDELRAVTLIPGRDGLYDVPPSSWASSAFFAERVFLSDDVSMPAPDGWEPYAGRTPFVRQLSFDKWLEHARPKPPPRPEDFPNPLDGPVWGLTATLAWIARRDQNTVLWQSPEWRRAHDLPGTSYALTVLAYNDDPTEEHPSIFNAAAAMKELKARCISNVIGAMAETDEGPVDMPPGAWRYATHTMDRNLSDEFSVGGRKYRNITFLTSDVMRVWPAIDGSEETPATPEATGPVSQITETPTADRTPAKRGPYKTEGNRIIQVFLNAKYNGVLPPYNAPALVNEILVWAETLTKGTDKRAAKGITEAKIKTFRKSYVPPTA